MFTDRTDLAQAWPWVNENLMNAPLSVGQAYKQFMSNEGSACNIKPTMETGCDPIVGYNAPYNCGCSGACGGNCKGKDPAIIASYFFRQLNNF